MSVGFCVVASLAILCSFAMGFYCGTDFVLAKLNLKPNDLIRPPKNCSSGKCSSGSCRVSSELITAHKKHLVARCEERGYELSEVMPCVVFQDGDMWTVNISHPKYPGKPKK